MLNSVVGIADIADVVDVVSVSNSGFLYVDFFGVWCRLQVGCKSSSRCWSRGTKGHDSVNNRTTIVVTMSFCNMLAITNFGILKWKVFVLTMIS